MLLKQYIEKIQALPGQESFCMTEEFKEVFGDAKGLETMASVSHANIDMVCQNVMMDENRWTMIDYEWAVFLPGSDSISCISCAALLSGNAWKAQRLKQGSTVYLGRHYERRAKSIP